MSTRLTRAAGAAAAGVLAAGLIGTLAAPAVAAPQDPPPDDYTRSIQLSWDGTEYADSTIENFLGAPVAVPGDSATRTLLVRNDGPTDGTLRATITNVELLDPDAPDVHHQPAHLAPATGSYAGAGEQGNFYEDLQIDWAHGHASMTQLAADGQTVILQIPLARGEQVPVTLEYELPLAATSGNRANVADRLASLQLVLELGGEFPTPPTPVPTEPTPAPAADPGDPPAASHAPTGSMPDTGADLRWPALAVTVLLALGALLVRSSRRREDLRGHH